MKRIFGSRTEQSTTVCLLLGLSALVGCSHSVGGRQAAAGAELFRIHCAGCHGADARGNGPVAEYIGVPVPNLTKLAANNGGEFPAERAFRVIDGQADTPMHGARHMPPWGYEFFDSAADDEDAHREATAKIDDLLQYLRTVQSQ